MDLKPFNQRQHIIDVLRRWRSQYPGDKDGVAVKLAKLNLRRCAASTVDKIIGNQSWTSFMCDCCGEYKAEGVAFGERMTDRPSTICGDCLKSAVAILGTNPRTTKGKT